MKRGRVRSSTCVGLSLLIVATSTAGCATTGGGSLFDDSKRAAAICGAGGALAGAAIGAAIGSSGRRGSAAGALIGAGIGALAGAIASATACFVVAEYRSRQVKGYEETRQATNYEPQQGDVLRITRYAVTPAAASPGTTVAFEATYHVMSPDPDKDISLTETRIVKRMLPDSGWTELGRMVSPVTAKPGTRQADGKWEVRSGVGEGDYLIIFEVSRGARKDAKELAFLVTTNSTQLAARAQTAEVVDSGAKAAASTPEAPQSAGTASSSPTLSDSPKETAVSATAGEASSRAPASDGAGPRTLAALGEQQPKAPEITVPAAASAPAPSLYFVATKVVGRGNVRQGPGTQHRIVAEISKADRFLILEQQGDPAARWYKIRLDDGREGWVAGSLGEEVRE
jgi:hypothetical protein